MRLESLKTVELSSRPSIIDVRRAIETTTSGQAASMLLLGSGLLAVASDGEWGLYSLFFFAELMSLKAFESAHEAGRGVEVVPFTTPANHLLLRAQQ
jgi:hypothetical protein